MSTKAERDFQEEMFPVNLALDRVIVWFQDNMSPEDVFAEKQLKQWAIDNGYEEAEG